MLTKKPAEIPAMFPKFSMKLKMKIFFFNFHFMSLINFIFQILLQIEIKLKTNMFFVASCSSFTFKSFICKNKNSQKQRYIYYIS